MFTLRHLRKSVVKSSTQREALCKSSSKINGYKNQSKVFASQVFTLFWLIHFDSAVIIKDTLFRNSSRGIKTTGWTSPNDRFYANPSSLALQLEAHVCVCCPTGGFLSQQTYTWHMIPSFNMNLHTTSILLRTFNLYQKDSLTAWWDFSLKCTF